MLAQWENLARYAAKRAKRADRVDPRPLFRWVWDRPSRDHRIALCGQASRGHHRWRLTDQLAISFAGGLISGSRRSDPQLDLIGRHLCESTAPIVARKTLRRVCAPEGARELRSSCCSLRAG